MDLKLEEYLHKVFMSYQNDHDFSKAMRRLHIKQVHLLRKNAYKDVELVKRFALLLSDLKKKRR